MGTGLVGEIPHAQKSPGQHAVCNPEEVWGSI